MKDMKLSLVRVELWRLVKNQKSNQLNLWDLSETSQEGFKQKHL